MGRLPVGKMTCFKRNAKTVDMFNVYQPALGSDAVGSHHSVSRVMSIFSLSVDSTEQRLLRSHLELFSREHVWGPRATIPLFLAAFPGSSSSLVIVQKCKSFSYSDAYCVDAFSTCYVALKDNLRYSKK